MPDKTKVVCVVGVPQWLNPGIAGTSDGIRVYVADGVIQLAFLGQITQSLFTATQLSPVSSNPGGQSAREIWMDRLV